MRKVKILLFAFIILSAAAGLYYYRQHNRKAAEQNPAVAPTSPLAMSKKDLNIPEGVIVESIKQKKWTDLSTHIHDPKKQSVEIETLLTQIIYSLDSNFVAATEHQHIYDAVISFTDKKALLTPRGILLLSKIFGKLNLSEAQKKNIETQYKKLKWVDKPAWLDVSMQWHPLPASTLKALSGLLVKGRSDLLADYFYNLNRIADKKTLAQQLTLGKKKMKSFPQEQQRFISDQVTQLERKLQTL